MMGIEDAVEVAGGRDFVCCCIGLKSKIFGGFKRRLG